MKFYVLDLNVLLRYPTKGNGLERIDKLFERAKRGGIRLTMSAVNWGEVLYNLAKRAGMQAAREALEAVARFVEPITVSEEDAIEAAVFKHSYKLGYTDCFAAALAMHSGARLVTSDAEFIKLDSKLKIPALPWHMAR